MADPQYVPSLRSKETLLGPNFGSSNQLKMLKISIEILERRKPKTVNVDGIPNHFVSGTLEVQDPDLSKSFGLNVNGPDPEINYLTQLIKGNVCATGAYINFVLNVLVDMFVTAEAVNLTGNEQADSVYTNGLRNNRRKGQSFSCNLQPYTHVADPRDKNTPVTPSVAAVAKNPLHGNGTAMTCTLHQPFSFQMHYLAREFLEVNGHSNLADALAQQIIRNLNKNIRSDLNKFLDTFPTFKNLRDNQRDRHYNPCGYGLYNQPEDADDFTKYGKYIHAEVFAADDAYSISLEKRIVYDSYDSNW